MSFGTTTVERGSVTLHGEMDSAPKQKVPNAGTRAAMAEADEIVKAGRARFATVEDMFAGLEETGRP